MYDQLQQSRHPIQASFDTNCVSNPLHPLWNDSSDAQSGIFGLPFGIDESSVAILPVPWDAACSQGTGTARAPDIIVEQSRFVELHDLVLGNIYERGIALNPLRIDVASLARQAQCAQATKGSSSALTDSLCQQLNTGLYKETLQHLNANRSVGVLGGDHSVSYGAIAAHLETFPDTGILQIDAHADLRPSLDGLIWSHASVMYHVMETLAPVSLTQVGIRGLCSIERNYQRSNNQIVVFTDPDIQRQLAQNIPWLSICDQIIDSLPENVYVTFDIDGLEPAYCKATGTPVPGGLSYTQAQLLLHRIVETGRTIRGFDLVEVGGCDEDALIAAHLLYTLCGIVQQRGAIGKLHG